MTKKSHTQLTNTTEREWRCWADCGRALGAHSAPQAQPTKASDNSVRRFFDEQYKPGNMAGLIHVPASYTQPLFLPALSGIFSVKTNNQKLTRNCKPGYTSGFLTY